MLRGMRRWAARLAIAIPALVLAAVLAALGIGLASLPSYDGRALLPGLGAEAVIERDGHAIPTILAASEADAYRGLGFAHGQDRLWQMELARRVGQGRLAELLGKAAEPTDQLMLVLGLARLARAAEAHLDPVSRRLMEAYAQGVNAAVAGSTALPPEFQILRTGFAPWAVADSLLVGRLLALELGQGWRREVQRSRLARALSSEQLRDLYPDQPPLPRTIATVGEIGIGPSTIGEGEIELPSSSGLGSNIFVASGALTASGLPMLGSDPHLGLRMPGHWYLARLVAPGLEVMGGTIPGLPAVVIGRNADVAWGFTNTGADTEDLFVERLDPADPERYLTPDGSRPFDVRTEAGLRVRSTRHGPVISDLPQLAGLASTGTVVALAWAALEQDDVTPAAGFDLARARDVAQVREALRRFTAPVQNAAFADRAGGIGFLTAGRIPIRRSGDGTLPADGSTGLQDWRGWIPFDQLPRVTSPPGGLIVNANNRVVGNDYPHLITRDWDGPLRAARIEELLERPAPLRLDDGAAIQEDQRSAIAMGLLPLLRPLRGIGETQALALAMLASWDGVMAVSRPEPLLFAGWYTAFRQSLIADELGPAAELLRNPSGDLVLHLARARPIWCDDVATPGVETCADLALRALATALPALQARWGSDLAAWRWGTAHRAQLTHEPFGRVALLASLFGGEVPVGGDASSVNVAAWREAEPAGPFAATHAAGLRMVVDLAQGSSSAVTATGQSGHPLSRHRDDLTWLWATARRVVLPHPSPPTSRLVLEPTPGEAR